VQPFKASLEVRDLRAREAPGGLGLSAEEANHIRVFCRIGSSTDHGRDRGLGR
jgi:hypothetical protein